MSKGDDSCGGGAASDDDAEEDWEEYDWPPSIVGYIRASVGIERHTRMNLRIMS